MKLKQWAAKHWRIWYISYVFIYLPWFFLTERLITLDHPHMHIMHTTLDDMIPFCEVFIIPYAVWFIYIAVSCIYMYFNGTDSEYRRFALSLIIGMSACLIICLIFPNGVDMRPDSVTRDNIFTRIIALLWSADSSANVFPSIHVYVSLAIHAALANTGKLAGHRAIRILSLITCISICLSTVFLKQHSVIDVIGACILMLIMYYFMYVPAGVRLISFRRA